MAGAWGSSWGSSWGASWGGGSGVGFTANPRFYATGRLNEPLAFSTSVVRNTDLCATILSENIAYVCVNPIVENTVVLSEPINKSTRIVGPVTLCKAMERPVHKGACFNG